MLNHNPDIKIISFLLSNVTSSILLKTLFSVFDRERTIK